MVKTKKRLFNLNGDTIEVTFVYDEESKRYFGEYPDFSETPRITPNGRRWVNVTMDGCPYADKIYGDCGSCSFFKCEQTCDLIGICDNDALLEEREENAV